MAIAAEDFTSDEPQQARDIDIAAIDAYLETAMAVAHIPGLALGIVQNDRIVHLILSAVQIVYGVLRITLTFRKPGLEPASA